MNRLSSSWLFAVLIVVGGVCTLQAQTVIYRNQMNSDDFRIISTNDLTGANTDTNIDIRTAFDYANGNVGENATGGPYPASIPEAPHTQVGDAPRTGLYMATNIQAGAISEAAALPLDPMNNSQLLQVTGDYDVQVDVWINYDQLFGVGTTEFAGLFIGHDGATAVRNGAGFIGSGEGGTTRDYRMYKNAFEQFIPSAQYNPEIRSAWESDADYDGIPDNAVNHLNNFWESKLTATDVGVALEPDDGQGDDQIGVLYPDDDADPSNGGGGGNLGFRWATMTFEVRPNEIGVGLNQNPGITRIFLEAEWETGDPLDPQDRTIINTGKFQIGRIDNSNLGTVVSMTGAIALVYSDLFASLNTSGFQFGIFDNLIVTQIDSGVPDGDLNGDGFVNAADYVFWRDQLGDDLSYQAWYNNFGATPGSGSSAAIPEPASCFLLLAGAALIAVGRRFRLISVTC